MPWSRTLSTYFLTSICETKSHTRTKQQTKLYLCIFLSVYFWKANGKKQYYGRNGSRHSLTSAYSYFLHDLLSCYSLLPTIWNLPHIMEQLHSVLILIINLFGNQSAEANVWIEDEGSARKLANKLNLFLLFTIYVYCYGWLSKEMGGKWIVWHACDRRDMYTLFGRLKGQSMVGTAGQLRVPRWCSRLVDV